MSCARRIQLLSCRIAFCALLSWGSSTRADEWNWSLRWFVAAAATGTSHFLDDSVYDTFQDLHHTPPLNRTMKSAELYGGLVAPVAGLLSFPIMALVGPRSENRWYQRSKKVFSSVAIFSVTSTTLKFVVGRHRPFQGADSSAGTPFSAKYSSFPSGHTGVAFAFSSSLAYEFDSYWVKIPLYTAAGMTGVARIYRRKHWFSDTVAAAFLGSFAALYSEQYFGPRAASAAEAHWQLFPSLAPGITGATLVGQFF